MNYASNQGVNIAWYSDGDHQLPALFLCNSIGTDHHVWDDILPVLSEHYRVIRMDTRGHGASDAPSLSSGDSALESPPSYTMEQLASDIEAVAQAAGLTRFSLCGVSLGAMMAMQYALDYPARVDKLILSNTSVQMDPAAWQTRIDTVRQHGMAAIVEMAMSRFFTPEYVQANSLAYQHVRSTFLALNPLGYTACCAAIRDMQLSQVIQGIKVPTLVLTGARDMSTPHAAGQYIAQAIPGAVIQQLSAAHIPANEIPSEFFAALHAFIQSN